MNRLALLRVLMGKWELLAMAGEIGPELAAAHSTVERWKIVKPFGDELAPAIDDIMAAINHPQAMQMMSTEAELEATMLAAMQAEFVEHNVKHATAGLVLAAGADKEATEKFHAAKAAKEQSVRAQATEEAKRRFDGHWLKLALQVFQTVGPMLATLAPLLAKA